MSDVTPGSDEDARLIQEHLAEQLRLFRGRAGAFEFEHTYEGMGRRVVKRYWRDGQEVKLHTQVSGLDWFDWAYARFGRSPTTIWISVPADGDPGQPRFELDRPPDATSLRDVRYYVTELELRPRPPELVPGWMKVELARVGAWDLRADAPTWKDGEPTGEPQTPESVGVPPPPGAEWAV